MRWILCCLLAVSLFGADAESVFDGKTLDGWQVAPADKAFWRVENGKLVADSNGKPMPRNTYLFSKKQYDHFEFRCKFKLTGDPKTGVINSGIQFRSAKKDWHPVGYQADIGDGWWGGIFEEGGRRKLVEADQKKVLPIIKQNDWNDYLIRANGPRIQLFINGKQTATYLERTAAISDRGHFAIQLHKGGVCRVEFKDMTVKKLDGGVDPSDKAAWSAAKNRITYLELQVSKIPQTPEKEHASFELADGFVAELVAQEAPGIGKFVAVDFDKSGKMWSMTALEYPLDAKREKTKAENLYKNGGKDKILVFDTPTAAGVQKPRTFATKLAIPLGVMPYKDGAIAQYGEDIRHYRDTDGDGKADKYDVILTGFSIADSHLMVHQFNRGPGGWTYFAQGLSHQSDVRRPDGRPFADGSKSKKYDRCRVARMKLDGSDFQYTTTGPNNVWGMVTGRDGEWFIQEANDKGYPVAKYDFGVFLNTGGTPKIKSYQPILPPIFETAIMGGTGLSGLVLAEDLNSPFAQEGKKTFYIANPLTSSVQIVTGKPLGNNRFEWEKQDNLLTSGDKWFRPVAAKFGPDGALYVVDWYNKIIAHGEVAQNHPDRDKVRGRIWRIRHKSQKHVTPPDLAKATDAELLKHLSHPNALVQRLAWLDIVDRKAGGLLPDLKAIATNTGQRLDVRLAALWAAEGLGGADAILLHKLATDKEANLRAEVVRIAGRVAKSADFAKIAKAAANDPAVRVRNALGEALVSRAKPDAGAMHAAALLGKAALTQGDRLTKYEREFERFLARWAMENNPDATTAMLGQAADLPVENRLLAMQSLKPEQAALAFLPMIPMLGRDLSTMELTLITSQLSHPKVLAGFKKLINDPARQRSMLVALSKADPGTSNATLNGLLVDACRQLVERENSAVNQALVMQTAQRHRLAALKDDIGKWILAAKDVDAILAGLRCLRELGPVDSNLCRSLLSHDSETVRREAVIGLSTAGSLRDMVTVRERWQILTATDKQAAINGLINSPSKATAFGKAVVAGQFGELDSGAIEKIINAMSDHPDLRKQLLKKLGDSIPMVIRLGGKNSDLIDSNVSLKGPFTMEGWMRLAGKDAPNRTLFLAKGKMEIGFAGGKLRLNGPGRKGRNIVIAKTAATPGQWTHYALTRDAAGKLSVFVDGALEATSKRMFGTDVAGLDLGAAAKDGGAPIEFLEFRVWKTALDAKAILEGMQVSYADDQGAVGSSNKRPASLAYRFSGETENLALKGGAQIAPASGAPTLMTAAAVAQQAAMFKKYHDIVAKPGDPKMGKIMFQGACAACHMVKNIGGNIGPDLSGAGTSDDEGLLRNILTPNAALEAGFYRHDLKLKDGSFVSGFMVAENKDTITIRLIGADDRIVSRNTISSHSISKRSLMPEGLISGMTDQQVADLFAYLRTLK